MKIEFRVDGGFAAFPGLARPVTIDVDTLPDDDAKRVRDAVDACRFFDRAESSSHAAPDMRRYEITVDDDGRHRTLSVPESDDDAGLRALVTLLEAQRNATLRR